MARSRIKERGGESQTLNAESVSNRQGRGGDKDCLGKGEPEIKQKRGDGNPVVNSGSEGKVRDMGGDSGGVSSDGAGDWGAIVVTKSKGDEIIKKEEIRANAGARTGASVERSVL